MCTAVTYKTDDFYFGRNLDYDVMYGESIVTVPRKFKFKMSGGATVAEHYAIIGMAHTADGYPLFYDAANEKGLCMAGLNFVGNAYYRKPTVGKENVASFELIPRILGKCATVKEARAALCGINITDTPFSERFPAAELHWMISDKNESITLESTREGVEIYDNEIGVLTNNPPFLYQTVALNNYMQLSPEPPLNRFAKGLSLNKYSRGMGAIGLPGDLSSQSRFVRAAFVKLNSVSGSGEKESVNQFFHILGSVEQQRGCCKLENGKYEITVYSSCINADKGIYYYTTYENRAVRRVCMHSADIGGSELSETALD